MRAGRWRWPGLCRGAARAAEGAPGFRNRLRRAGRSRSPAGASSGRAFSLEIGWSHKRCVDKPHQGNALRQRCSRRGFDARGRGETIVHRRNPLEKARPQRNNRPFAPPAYEQPFIRENTKEDSGVWSLGARHPGVCRWVKTAKNSGTGHLLHLRET